MLKKFHSPILSFHHFGSLISRYSFYIADTSPSFLKNCVLPQEINIKTENLRYDKILSILLDVSRHRIGLQTINNTVYLNGSQLKKKGKKIKMNDVIEVDFESNDKRYLYSRNRVEVSKLTQVKHFFNVTFKLYRTYGFVLKNDSGA